MGKKETREWKSNSFSLLMKEKKYALETYNLLNGTCYKDEQLIEILELDGGISLTVRNDASFILDSELSIYEHQSTWSPNMPLRLLVYTANLYKQLVDWGKIYGKKLLEIPRPRYVVFYNGKDVIPEDQILRLSDAYKGRPQKYELELTCRVLNINPGYNVAFKREATGIGGYCRYVEKTRKYSETETAERAIRRAIDECIEEGILTEFFKEKKEMIISADALDLTYETREAHAREEARNEGRAEGQKIIDEQAMEIARLKALLKDREMSGKI